MSRLVLFVVALVLGVSSQATTYFVSSTSGNDLNSGLAESSPWKTIDRVNSAMSSGAILPGDKVLLKRGDVFGGPLQPRSGLPGLPVTVGAYGFSLNGLDIPNVSSIEIHDRSNVVISGLRVNIGHEGEDISIENSSDIRIEGVQTFEGDFGIHLMRGNLARITIRGSSVDSADLSGVFVGQYESLQSLTIENSTVSNNLSSGINFAHGTNQGANVTFRKVIAYGNLGGGVALRGVSNLRFIDCDISGNQGIGLAIFNAAWDISLEGSKVNDNAQAGLQLSQDANRQSETISDIQIVDSKFLRNGLDGFALRGRGSDIRVLNSEASGNLGDGFNIKNSWTQVLFERCSANENGLGLLVAGGGDGFSFHNTSSGAISRCYAKDNAKSAAGHIDASSVDMINNLFLHSSQGTWPLIHGSGTGTFNIWHNTLVTGAITGTGIRLQNGAKADVRNNIVVGGSIGITKSQMASFAEDNDILWGMGTPFQYFKGGPRSLVANPLFQNPAAGDFRPNYQSPAIDYATWVGVLYDHLGIKRKNLLQNPKGLGLVPYGDVGAFEQYEYLP